MNESADRWERVQSLFHGAVDREPADRREWLEHECADDPTLIAEVGALLDEDSRSGSILDREFPHIAHEVLDGSVPLLRAIGPYRILSVLGHGGMGVVYLAQRTDLGSRAAIKVLRDASLSPARRERFAFEQRTLAQLNHPSIARLYDADVLPDGTPFFVMEYVDGVPLTEHCESRDLDVPERLRLFRTVCDAVLFAHGQAVVHRDLKPSNVLVTTDGTVKLLDFGISKHIAELETGDRTETGLRVMTPAYAAPEQVLGKQTGTYTDVYALGVILYELLAGRLPFNLSRFTPGQSSTVVVDQEPRRPSVAAREVTGGGVVRRAGWADLDVLCLTAMHKDPQRRYRTVDALIRDIDHYLRGEPLEARPDSTGYRLGKFVRRNWRPLSAGVVMLLTLMTLVAFYTIRLARARDAAVAETARTQRIQNFVLNLFTGGDEAAGPADTLRVVTLLDRGIREANLLDADPAIQAELLETLGGIFQHLGNVDRADSLLSAALEHRRSIAGENDLGVASGEIALGLLRTEQAQYDGAEELLRSALATRLRLLSPDDPSVIEARTSLAKVMQARGEYDDAIAAFEQALQTLSARDPDGAGVAETLGDLANTHYYAGHLEVADSINRIVIAMDRKRLGPRHPNVADDLINLGAIQFDLGNYPEAEAIFRESRDIFSEYYGEDHIETAAAELRVGQALQYEGRLDEAQQLVARALSVRERVYGADHPLVATALNYMASIELGRHNHAAAEQSFRRVADIYRATQGERHPFVAIALSNLASVYMDAGDYVRAEPIYRDVIGRLNETLEPQDLNIGIARIKLGRVLLREGKVEEAEQQSLAGYEILAKQTNPTVSWLRSARNDLIEAYSRLHQPEKATRFIAEQQAITRDSAAAAAK
jgi:eukaryotic-like serine/threonine-protein kinase